MPLKPPCTIQIVMDEETPLDHLKLKVAKLILLERDPDRSKKAKPASQWLRSGHEQVHTSGAETVLNKTLEGVFLFAIQANKMMINMALLLADKPIWHILSPCY